MKEEEPLKKGQRLLKEDKRPEDAVVVFKEMALGNEDYEGEALKKKESAIEGLVESLVEMKDQDGLKNVLVELRPMFGKIAKAKTAKIVRTVIDGIAKIPDSTETLVSCCLFLLLSWLLCPQGVRKDATICMVHFYHSPAIIFQIDNLHIHNKHVDDRVSRTSRLGKSREAILPETTNRYETGNAVPVNEKLHWCFEVAGYAPK